MNIICIVFPSVRLKKRSDSRSIGAICARKWKSFLFSIKSRAKSNSKSHPPREEKKTRSGGQSKKHLTNRLPRDIIKSLKGKQSPRERKKMTWKRLLLFCARCSPTKPRIFPTFTTFRRSALMGCFKRGTPSCFWFIFFCISVFKLWLLRSKSGENNSRSFLFFWKKCLTRRSPCDIMGVVRKNNTRLPKLAKKFFKFFSKTYWQTC